MKSSCAEIVLYREQRAEAANEYRSLGPQTPAGKTIPFTAGPEAQKGKALAGEAPGTRVFLPEVPALTLACPHCTECWPPSSVSSLLAPAWKGQGLISSSYDDGD